MSESSVSVISFPQLFPALGVSSSDLFRRGIAAVRGVFSFAMALYLLAVIFPGSEFPIAEQLSTYAYVAFATIATYQARAGGRRRLAALTHLVGFTAFTLGNAALSALVWHHIAQGLLWFAWLPGTYVDSAAVLCQRVGTQRAVVSSSLVLVVGCIVWMLLARPPAAALLLWIPIAHVGSISLLRLAPSARRYFSRGHDSDHVQSREPRGVAERRLNAERAATQLQLDRINRSLTMGAVAACIAHEISQPLAAVVTNASAAANWLHEDHPNLVEARNAVSRVVEGGHRASAVISSFRTMLSGDAPQREPVQLNELLLEALKIRAPEIQKESVTVLTPSLEAVPDVYGDGVQLRQVFLNLITNAVDAMTEVIDRPRLLIIHCEEDDAMCAVVSVEDNGPGLATKDPKKIFEPFFSTKSKGMGMGLFISRMIVEAHGGNLRVHSGPGRTRFVITIPTTYAR